MKSSQRNSLVRKRNDTNQRDFPDLEKKIGSNLRVAHPKAKTIKINIGSLDLVDIKQSNTHLRVYDQEVKKKKRENCNWRLTEVAEPIRYQHHSRNERDQQPLRYLRKISKREDVLRTRHRCFSFLLKKKKNPNRRISVPFPEVAFNKKQTLTWPFSGLALNQNKDSNLKTNVPFPEVEYNKKQLIPWPSDGNLMRRSWNGKIGLNELKDQKIRKKAIEVLVKGNHKKEKLPNLSLPIYSRLIHPRYPRAAKLVWVLAFVACASGCFYNTGKCFKEFFNGAPQITVEFEKINIMPLPSITVCPTDIFGYNKFTEILIKKYCHLPDNKDPRCIPPIQFTDISTTDILHPPEITVQDIWTSYNLSKLVVPLSMRCSTRKSDQDCIGPVSMTPKAFFGGTCLKVQTYGVLKTWGAVTEINGTADISNLEITLTIFNLCLRLIQHSQDEDVTFLDLDFGLFLPLFIRGTLRVIPTQLIVQNTYLNPCRDSAIVEECKSHCLEKILHSKVKCKLPFMTSESLSFCNNSKDFAEVIDVMKKVVAMKQNCSAKCPRACVSYQFSYLVDILAIHNKPALYFSAGYNDDSIRTIKEYYWYTFSLLISDIGGNLGFFLAVNLLTFVEIFELIFAMIKSCFKPKKKETIKTIKQWNQRNSPFQQLELYQKEEPFESSYGIVGFNRIVANNVSIWRKIIWLTVILLSGVACAFLIRHSINSFLYGDPDVAVLFELNDTVKIPTITICPYKAFERYEKIVARKEMYATDFNITDDLSNIPVSDLLHIEDLNVTELWDDAAIDMNWLEKIDIHCRDFIQVTFFDIITASNPRPVSTILGTCLSITLEQMIKYHGHSTSICLTFQTQEFSIENPFTIIMFMHNDEDDPRTLDLEKGLILKDQLLQLISMEFVKLEFITRKKKPCSDSESVAKCKVKCFDDLFEKKLPCKLPFMSNSSRLRYCSKPGEFNESMSIATDIYANRLMNDVCKCPRKCTEYLISSSPDRNSILKPIGIPINIFYVYFTNNLFTLIREHSRLNVFTLFSSICGSLGLFLGFCALSILEIMESIIISLSRKFNNR